MTINDAIKEVVNKVNPSWPTIYKIRFVYLSIGKLLQKDTDFFFSVDDKLFEKNMSVEEIEKVYLDNKSSGDLKVICRSAAYILQRIYDELGITSKLIKSNNNVINYEHADKTVIINHWFLAVYDEGKAYFLTLASDLPYIQMGMQTRHFATNIPYKKHTKSGEEIQVYCGKEIHHTVLTDKELRDIDLNIGYIRNQYKYDEEYRPSKDWHYNYGDAALMMLNSSLKNNNLYYELELQSTKFYNRITEFKSNNKTISLIDTKLNTISKEEWFDWLKILCRFVHRKIEKIIGYKIFIETYYDSPNWNYDDWVKDVCIQMQRYLYGFVSKNDDDLYIEGDFNYTKWSRKMKKAIQPMYDESDYSNVLLILDKTNVLANMVLYIGPQKNFSTLLNSLSLHFIKKDFVLENAIKDGVVSSKYIAHKFRTLFRCIFSCNGSLTDFNKMDYSEQIVVLKMILDRMFPELNKENSILDEGYDERYSVVQNRIQTYAIKHKEKDKYAMIFHIVGDDSYDDTYYFYDPKENIFNIANILNIDNEYVIISNRLRTRIEDLEDIEQKKTK
ncbi:MAG: hypothetical protein ACI4XM_06690 [Candidatus Coprovivens sp.]